jgi:hypothetical protein
MDKAETVFYKLSGLTTTWVKGLWKATKSIPTNSKKIMDLAGKVPATELGKAVLSSVKKIGKGLVIPAAGVAATGVGLSALRKRPDPNQQIYMNS